MNFIENLLRTEGPLLSSELIKILVQNFNLNEATARKRLSRLKPPITKIKGYFSNNQALYHLHEQFRKENFYKTIVNAFKTDGKKYYSIIKAIEFHYGYLNEKELPSYTFSPIQNLKGHKRLDNIVNELEKLGIIVSDQENHYSLCRYLSVINNFRHYKAVETAKNFILCQFNEWARNIGLVSYEKGKYYTQFGKFCWAYVAPSYITTLTKFKDNKIIPSFVICDILIG